MDKLAHVRRAELAWAGNLLQCDVHGTVNEIVVLEKLRLGLPLFEHAEEHVNDEQWVQHACQRRRLRWQHLEHWLAGVVPGRATTYANCWNAFVQCEFIRLSWPWLWKAGFLRSADARPQSPQRQQQRSARRQSVRHQPLRAGTGGGVNPTPDLLSAVVAPPGTVAVGVLQPVGSDSRLDAAFALHGVRFDHFVLHYERFLRLRSDFAATTAAHETRQQEEDLQRLMLASSSPSTTTTVERSDNNVPATTGTNERPRIRSPRTLRPMTVTATIPLRHGASASASVSLAQPLIGLRSKSSAGAAAAAAAAVASMAAISGVQSRRVAAPDGYRPNNGPDSNSTSNSLAQPAARVPALVAKKDQRCATQLLRAIAAGPDEVSDEQTLQTVRRLVETQGADKNGRLIPFPWSSAASSSASSPSTTGRKLMLQVSPLLFAVAFNRNPVVEYLIGSRADANKTPRTLDHADGPNDNLNAVADTTASGTSVRVGVDVARLAVATRTGSEMTSNANQSQQQQQQQGTVVVTTSTKTRPAPGLQFAPLLVAVEQRNHDMLRQLVGPGRANLEHRDDLDGHTALTKAVYV